MGLMALGGAAFVVGALVGICPKDRFFFSTRETGVLEVNKIENFLLGFTR